MSGVYRALLVANSTFYNDPDHLPELKAPIYDMSRVRDVLIHPELGMFAHDDVRLLPNLQSTHILSAMEDFFQSAGPEDTLLLYYSGHGKTDINNNFFLCASNTRLDRLMSTAIRDEQVNAMIRGSPARTFVVILDCCSSGAWKSPAAMLPDALKGVGRFIIASSRAGQNSGDAGVETESSAFTKHLVAALEAGDLDADQDGFVDIDEVYRYVETRLRVEGQQAQRDFGKSTRTVALARRRAATPAVEPEPRQDPVGASEPPTLSVSPEAIHVVDVDPDDLPTIERIYVYNRGGGDLAWDADSDDDWISLKPHHDYVRVSIAPRGAGRSRSAVYIRDRGPGGMKRVPVVVDVRAEPEPELPASAPERATSASTSPRRPAASPQPPNVAPSASSSRKRLVRELKKRGYTLGDPYVGESSTNIYYADGYPRKKPRIVIRGARIRIERLNADGRAFELWRSFSLLDEFDAALAAIDRLKRSAPIGSRASSKSTRSKPALKKSEPPTGKALAKSRGPSKPVRLKPTRGGASGTSGFGRLPYNEYKRLSDILQSKPDPESATQSDTTPAFPALLGVGALGFGGWPPSQDSVPTGWKLEAFTADKSSHTVMYKRQAWLGLFADVITAGSEPVEWGVTTAKYVADFIARMPDQPDVTEFKVTRNPESGPVFAGRAGSHLEFELKPAGTHTLAMVTVWMNRAYWALAATSTARYGSVAIELSELLRSLKITLVPGGLHGDRT